MSAHIQPVLTQLNLYQNHWLSKIKNHGRFIGCVYALKAQALEKHWFKGVRHLE